ncbi:hypothetical protein [Jiangella anatolica]|uniref:Uncharacterized protein n=1 Tax=Jiangella anatolica TaxID=2670374 RepID=A0A2W2BKG3_9ACTN|nr:hypothetical protein [Jiangella anatolica]PZF80834.1 hypothetical protein C1I92_24025 [Jiangella anatolica]
MLSDPPDAVELVAGSDAIVAQGPDAPADVAAAVTAALESLKDAAANQERLRDRLQACVYLAVAVAWLSIGVGREWSKPWSLGRLWGVVAPLAATAWVVVAVATVTIVVLVVARVLRRRPGQSTRSALVELWESLGRWPADRQDQWFTMFGPLLNVAVLGVAGLLLWPREPYGDWNVVVPPLATLVVLVGLLLFAEAVVLARHRQDPRDGLVTALYQTYATAVGVAIRADDPVDWRQSRRTRADLAGGLNQAAVAAERDFKRIAPHRLADARRRAGDLGQRIAVGFRVHANAVLLGGRDRDDRLAPALAAGLVAASRGQWEELARAEPASAAPRIVTSIVRRVFFAALIVGAGLLLSAPFDDAGMREQLRGVFLTAALLPLITPRSALQQLGDQVRQTAGLASWPA